MTKADASARATQIQAAFRGYRARRRVVWDVRHEIQAFVAETERELEVERLLLGVAPMQRLQDAGGSKTLQLPRFEDVFLGVSQRYPMGASVGDDASSVRSSWDAVDDHELCPPPAELTLSIVQRDEEEDATPSDVEAQEGRTESHASVHEASDQEEELEDDDDLLPAVDNSLCSTDEETQIEAAVVTEQPLDGHGVHGDEANGTLAADASAAPHTPKQIADDGNTCLEDPVERILATHSREELLQELEWTKRALQERLRYLRTRHLTEQTRRLQNTV
ncbi:hypothetical protein ATCC90586_003822 [Pythium insidiosum]|nr:hypothetical protein ATCC90586_003822 [Pythium insidiosum]